MNKILYWFLNSLVFIIPLLMDRISKNIIVTKNIAYKTINEFLYFDLTFNRGISWGIFNVENNIIFILVTLLVIGITLFLILLTIEKIKKNQMIIGEILVLSGAISNIIDRFIFKGVVDFIVFDYQGWSWPAFNIADFCIVIGVIIMFITSIHPVRPERVEGNEPIIKI